ncbi:hypothetical protein J2R87_009755 [Bradyrhizobium elkanii]|nr:hypothetical protein [Bradyrhizobium elkanii]MCP1975948.1 hypothetical protein [Bradyrhizobium elkanii]MCP1984832.1 hypothetical protein [Bradyrhizobium elkanii]MCS3695118.1 hypothetical protein [Bradyrhizobium elkanii]MCS3890815.1 hypothetical protein [Bradyrhizobium elkanii]
MGMTAALNPLRRFRAIESDLRRHGGTIKLPSVVMNVSIPSACTTTVSST